VEAVTALKGRKPILRGNALSVILPPPGRGRISNTASTPTAGHAMPDPPIIKIPTSAALAI
jgi:hypothetical protein